MLSQQILETVLWVVPATLEAVIVAVMLARGLYRKLPYFFSYVAYDALNTVSLSALKKHPAAYFYGYWYGELLSWVLILVVIYEIYANLLKEYAVLQKIGIFLFWIMGIVLSLIALWTAFNTSGSGSFRFVQTVLTMERSMRIVQAGLLLALFVFASFFGLSWKNYLFGIALGFAVFVCVELAIVAVRIYGEHPLIVLYRWFKPASYNLGALIWTFYVVKQGVSDLRFLPRTELAAWNDTLQELLHR